MKPQEEKIIADFEKEERRLYGDQFVLEQIAEKIVVLTDGQARKLRELLGESSDLTVVSLDKDSSVGKYYRIKSEVGKLNHYYRSEQEWERITENLNPSMITTEKSPSGEHILISELMPGEVFRGLETEKNPGWLAVAVCHDFEDIAPKQLGWIKLDENIENIPERSLTRPKDLINFDDAVKKYTGVKYHLGGKSIQTGYDCSALTQQIVFETKGVWLPKLARWQAMVGKTQEAAQAQKPDLVFFEEAPHWYVEHVGFLIEKDAPLHVIFHVSRHAGPASVYNMNDNSYFRDNFRVHLYARI